MIAAAPTLDALKRQRPEWAPWLAVVGEVLRETTSSAWDAMIPPLPASPSECVPLVAQVPLGPNSRAIRHLFDRLVRVASRGDTPRLSTLHRVALPDVELATLFEASVWQEHDRVSHVAAVVGADTEALQAIVSLVPVPFLQACNRRWSTSVRGDWNAGYCPVCGAWPAFAEVRGIERSRCLRCGRCGGEWYAHALVCPYCSTNDHEDFESLVPSNGASNAVVEACKRCHGYVKSFTTLQGSSPATVMIQDLATVNLDVAALDQGYRRPDGAGYRRGSWT